jgi:hypothetical protein
MRKLVRFHPARPVICIVFRSAISIGFASPFFPSMHYWETPMNHFDVVKQTRIEKEMLKSLIEGLRNTLAWKTHEENLSRKLSTLKFVMRSFQSHLDRLMRIEEHDGYMDIVLEKHPHLGKTVESLRFEHDIFRREISLIAAGLERVVPTDQNLLNNICNQVAGLLVKVDVHTQKEADLFQEAFERENGGEG